MRVAVTTSSFGQSSAAPLELLKQAGVELVFNPHGRKLEPAETIAVLNDAVGVVAGTEKYSADVLAALPALRVISRVGVGVDAIDHAEAARRGVAVKSTPDAHVDAVAELTLGGILSSLRRLHRADHAVRSGGWTKPMGALLRGKRVGLLGYGRVGRAVARLCQAFGAEVAAYDPVCAPSAAAGASVHTVETFSELLASADILSIHIPYSDDVQGLIGAEQLALMKRDALLVNTSRGGIVDEAALLAWLQANPTAFAFLDVFVEEPYRGPLKDVDNTLLTTHIGSYAREVRERMETEAVVNLLEALRTGART